jgi:ferrous iron transport protein A
MPTMMVSMERPLSAARLHETVVLRRIGGARAFRRRLLELGFVAGTPLRLVGIAPLGDPYEIEVRGGRISIRRSEADSLLVEGATPAASLPATSLAAAIV